MASFFKRHLVLYSDWVKNKDGSPGIWRLYLFFCSRFSIRINVVWEDEPNTNHNHNWDALSLILIGGYKETTYNQDGSIKAITERRTGSLRLQKAAEWHRTDYLDRPSPAVTLYIAGRHRRDDEWRKDDGSVLTWCEETVLGRS